MSGVPCTLMRGGTSKGLYFLAGVGPFAIEHGLVAAGPETTAVRINMLNTNTLAVATIETPGGRVRMNLGDVAKRTVPKMCLIAPPRNGGAVSTRTFIPHRVHKTIGVLGAVSVATACASPGSVAEGVAVLDGTGRELVLDVEHPAGRFTVAIDAERHGGGFAVQCAALLRTARKIMDGMVYPREAAA